jgi:hypothetical protein
MKLCPRCDVELASSATSCRCGWADRRAKQIAEARQDVPCAHDNCIAYAIVRIKTPTGLAAMCKAHYDKYYLDLANKRCELLGLNTVSEKKKWVQQEMNKLYRKLANDQPWATPSREPGEDENYTYIQA